MKAVAVNCFLNIRWSSFLIIRQNADMATDAIMLGGLTSREPYQEFGSCRRRVAISASTSSALIWKVGDIHVLLTLVTFIVSSHWTVVRVVI